MVTVDEIRAIKFAMRDTDESKPIVLSRAQYDVFVSGSEDEYLLRTVMRKASVGHGKD